METAEDKEYFLNNMIMRDVKEMSSMMVCKMSYKFKNSDETSLDLDGFDTSYETNMSYMFQSCSKLEKINLEHIETSEVIDMRAMFFDCPLLTTLDLSNFDTSNAADMRGMFAYCNSLKSLDISNFDFSKIKPYCTSGMFTNCASLIDLKFGKNLKTSLDLSDCPLSYESALSVINGLAQVINGKSIYFSEEVYDQLSTEDIQKAKEKNWIITFFIK